MGKFLAILAVVGTVVGIAACWFAGPFLIAPAPATIGAPPSDLPAETVSCKTDDSRPVKGWFVSGLPGRAAVILLHRLGANRRAMLGRAGFLHKAGYSILMLDFHGHGETPGNFMTFGYLEAEDASAGVRYLKHRLPNDKIGVLGVSLGGAAALLGSTSSTVDALVPEAIFTDLAEAVENRLVNYLGSWGRYLSPVLLWQVEPRQGFNPEDLAPIDRIGAIKAPLLLIAGSKDKRVTLGQSRRLYERAPNPKTFWVLEGARHQNFHLYARQDYERRLLKFFGQHLR